MADIHGWPPPDGGAPHPHRRRGRTALGLGLTVAVAVAAGIGIDHAVRPSAGSTGATAARSGPGGSSSGAAAPGATPSARASAGADQIAAGLVDINVTLGYRGLRAAGTGIVLTPDGEVLTNNHVITGATRIVATDVGNGRSYTASVTGYDRSHDLAVLHLQSATGLSTELLGDSATVGVGDQVSAVGNAGGTGGKPSVAPGSVVALGQSIVAGDTSSGDSEQLSGLIQVNADVQPGDSGGPLVDASGRVVGVDTAAAVGFQARAAGGQGYAIPINQAVLTSDQITSGRASTTVHIGPTAFLGVDVSPPPGQGVPGDPGGGGSTGAQVVGVVAGSPAEQTGLSEGDLITAVDGSGVASADTLTGMISGHRPGDRIQLTWTDSTGQQHTATARLGSGPPA